MKKILTVALAGFGLASLSTLSFANLIINNTTMFDSTSSIKGNCTSTKLGSKGITSACKSSSILGAEIAVACGIMKGECDAIVYLSNNCDPSTAIGTAKFDMQQGFEGFEATNPQYMITGTGFNITIQDLNHPNACPPAK